MMAPTHSRTSEAAVFATTAYLLNAYSSLATASFVPDYLRDWLLVPAALRPRLSAATSTLNPSTSSFTLSLSLNQGPQLADQVAQTGQDVGRLILTFFFLWLIANFAGQLPDIDTPGSRSANMLEKLGERLGSKHNLLLRLIFGILNFIPQSISWFANSFMGGHRGIVHSLPFTLLVSFGFGILTSAIPFLGTPFYGTLFGVAFATHLFIDSFTKAGTLPLAPFSRWKLHLLPFGLSLETSSTFWNSAMQLVAVALTVAAVGLGILPALALFG